MLSEARQQLAAKGAGLDVQAYVEQLLLERHQSYNAYMTAEADKRRHLLDHFSKLEVSHCTLYCIVLPHNLASDNLVRERQSLPFA